MPTPQPSPSEGRAHGRPRQERGEGARESAPLRCHGRHAELTRIGELYQHAASGQGATFLLVSGPHAVGKSTLLAEAHQRLRQLGALTLEARCAPGLRSHGPLLEVTRRAWEHLCSEGVDDALLGQAEGLFDLLQGRASGEPGTRPEIARLRLYERLASLLQQLGERRPTVVVIHDLDLADRPTLQLLAYLGRTLAGRPELTEVPFRGLIIASCTGAPAELSQIARAGGLRLERLELGGLDVDGVRHFLGSEEVVRRVLGLTRGDPALLEALTSQEPTRRADDPLAEASESEARLLELVAVFGRPLGAETLRLLTRLPLSELGRCIAQLTRRRVLDKLVVDGELRVGLARAGDQAAIHEAIPPARRRALHAEIGAYLEARGEEELEACASHLLHSGRRRKAVLVTLEAGQRLELSLCFERAAELYERALPLASPAQTLELCRRLRGVLRLAGRLDRALEYARRCLEARPDDTDAALVLVDLHLLRRDPAAARDELERIERRAGASLDKEELARLLALTARACYQAGDRRAAREAATRGLALDPAVRQRVSLQNTLGKLSLEDGETDQARALFVDNLERSRAAGLSVDAALAEIQLGLIELEGHAFDEAERRYCRALELTRAMGEHRLQGACLQHLAVIAERRGAYDLALARYQEAVTLWKQAWLRGYLAWVALDLGRLYLRLGHVERARAMAALSERMESAEVPLRGRINRALLHGCIARHECHYGEAEARFRQAEELALSGEQVERQLEAQLELAELRLEQGLPGEALALLAARVCPPAAEHLQLRALLLQGRALLASERFAEARGPLAEALERGDQLPDPEVAWQSRYLLSRVARQQGREAEARRLLARAATLEADLRQRVPRELLERVVEQPLRRGLDLALRQGSSAPISPPSTVRPPSFAGMVGRHPRMQQVFAHVEKVAPTDALVLIRGESGTGKELVADAIHRGSRRAKRPLVKVNCGALVESLLLSELFGHERGAFTGATERRKGRFEAADGGTIFLDEIGDISPATQVALLRVLQHQSFERVGGTTPITVDVRIICATNRDLEQLVAEGRFREDLYYRLKGFVVEVPPLRERIDDLPALCEHLLAAVARERTAPVRRLEADALRLLQRHGWPGNIRELENVLRSVSLLSDNAALGADDFTDYPELGSGAPTEHGAAAGGRPHPYEQIRQSGLGLRELKKQIEHECIIEALQESAGSIAGAARLLGIKRPRLSQMIKEHGITVPRSPS